MAISLGSLPAANPGTTSEVLGVQKTVLNSGANFISVPFHPLPTYRGTLSAASGSTVTFSGTPGWSASQFAPVAGIPQFIALVRKDASASPGVEGDWWHVTGNTANSLTVNSGGGDLSTYLAAGDELEIRRLTSIKDLFGSGTACLLNKDNNFDILVTEEDVIRFVSGTSFSGEVFYHDGTLDAEGYYLNGTLVGTGDGSAITLNPNQPIMVFRKTGSPPLTLAVGGHVQTVRFTHYLAPGANALGVVFPVETPLNTSNLKESGWVSDTNFDILATEEDVIRSVTGTSFGEEIFHYAGSDDVTGWYVNGTLNDTYAFQPAKGYIFFIKGPGPLFWRQTVPFNP